MCLFVTVEEKMSKNLAAETAPMAMNTTAGRLTAEPLSVESLNPLVMENFLFHII